MCLSRTPQREILTIIFDQIYVVDSICCFLSCLISSAFTEINADLYQTQNPLKHVSNVLRLQQWQIPI